MQSTTSSTSTLSDIIQTMQPQSAQNMFVPSAGSNNTNTVRTSQPAGGLFRGPPTAGNPGSRNNTRHVTMQTMQAMHQGVVVPTFTQFTTRQPTYQAPFSYSQPIQQYNYQYFPYYPLQQQPQAHQRSAVGVNAGVGVGATLPVNQGPSPLNAAQGGAQAQIPLPAGTMLSGAMNPGTGAVLSVAAPTSGQPVGVPPIVGVVSSAVPSPPTQTTNRRRKHALEIIDPNTNKNILEDLELPKHSSNTEVELPEAHTELQQDQIGLCLENRVPTESKSNITYSLDLNQITQHRDTVASQTPVVSAITDAPSVEILPIPQKIRTKKVLTIVAPKEADITSHTGIATENIQHQHPQQKLTDESENVSTNIEVKPNSNQSNQLERELNTQQVSLSKVEYVFDDTAEVEHQEDTTLADSNAVSQVDETARCSICSTELEHQSEVMHPNLQTPQQEQSSEENSTSIEDERQTEMEAPTDQIQLNKIEQPSVVAISESIIAQTVVNATSIGIEVDTTILIENQNISAAKGEDPNLSTKQQATASNNFSDKSDTATTDETDRATLPNDVNINSRVQTDALDKENNILKTHTKQIVNDNLNSETTLIPKTINVEVANTDSSANSNNNNVGSTTALSSRVQSLITYNEGQWSPNNPTGKKQYDKEQLLQLREARASRVQPDVNNAAILPQPMYMMPSFARSNNNKRVQSMVGSIGASRGADGGMNNYINKQSSMSGVHGRNSMKGGGGIYHVNLSLNQDVKLNETDNAWRPRVLQRNDESEEDSQVKAKREKEDLIKRVRGILNKLTPEKFDALVEEIIKLKIDTPDKMEEVMVLVFEKAIDEPNFSVSYARLCLRLINEVKARDERMESGTKTNLGHFRNALLDKTEREFTQNVTQSSAKAKKLEPIIEKIKSCTDPAEKAELEAQLEEEERKIRRRSGGTVRFIGELFKISMLTGKIINSCIETLLNPQSEDMLECMCKLLTTVGEKFEHTPMYSKEPIRLYSLDTKIARMQAIANKTDKEGAKISSRVRFMLQDVIDLRKNKWQSTKNEAPKTMEQIEQEAKTEQYSQYINYSSVSSNAGQSMSQGSAGKRDDRGFRYNDSRSSAMYGGSHSQRGDSGSLRRQQQSGGGNNSSSNAGHANGNNEEWIVQTSKGSRSLAVDSTKLELVLNQNQDIETKKMGGLAQFLWNKEMRQPTAPAPSNPFAALSSLGDSNRSSTERDRDRSGPRNKGSYNKGSMERDRYSDRNINSRNSSSQSSRENSSSRSTQAVRSMINPLPMQKTVSHSKYTQQMQSTRMPGKAGPNVYRSDQFMSQHQSMESSPNNSAPAAIFEEPTDSELTIIKSVVSELIENVTNLKIINASTTSCMSRICDKLRCGFLYYILTEYLHLRDVGQIQRRCLANIVIYLMKHNFISLEHFKLSYKNFCTLAADLKVDIPELWLYIFEFTGPLIAKKILTLNDLWIKELKSESPSSGPSFLKTFLTYCGREIGPNFTRTMWKKLNLKWTDFMPESEVKTFIEVNKFEYIENDATQYQVEVRDSSEKHINKIVEHVDYLLRDGSNADSIIDYVNGNVAEVDKQLIRNLTTTVCNFAIVDKDSNYKLDSERFGKICIPVLQRNVDCKEDRALECLYSMQLLVNGLEHPRGLLSELFVELYDADVIPQDSFLKWRDSKDQSLGKGVAVKGLNQFFNHILSGETSDD